MKIDLHTHTTFSDGQLTPEKLVALAVKKKINCLSVTDHDTVDGLLQIEELCGNAKIEWIPGIEISSHCGEEEVHLLAYHIYREDPKFLDFLSAQKNDRNSRIDAMVKKLQDHGVLIEKRDLEPYLKDSALPGRPHLAQALVRKGYVPNLKEAFRIYLSPNRPGYVPRQVPEASVVLEKIRENGGVAVLAHPGLLRDRSIPEKLKKEGLQGIEAFHPSHKKSEMKAFAVWAEQNRLIVTGGSDFHGFKGERNTTLGSLPVPPETLEKLRKAAMP
jgi:predicted metal-dependent phosphoesterase TrpH